MKEPDYFIGNKICEYCEGDGFSLISWEDVRICDECEGSGRKIDKDKYAKWNWLLYDKLQGR